MSDCFQQIFGARKSYYWKRISQFYHTVGNSIIIKKKLPNDLFCYYRPFSIDENIIEEVFSESVYDKIYQPPKGSIVFDVGAHIGLFTLKVTQKVGEDGLIYSIEPHPRNLALLKKNIDCNKLRNVKIVSSALHSKNGVTKLFLSKTNTGEHTIIPKDEDSPKRNYIIVSTLTLDNFGKEIPYDKHIFIKMDCEGAESEILKGGKELLNKYRVIVSIATYHSKAQNENIQKYLKSFNFKIICTRNYLYGKNF